MATGIEIAELPEVPVTPDSMTVLQNSDTVGRTRVADLREAVGVSVDSVELEVTPLASGSEPAGEVEEPEGSTDQHKKFKIRLGVPRATHIASVTVAGKTLDAGDEPTAEMTEGGTADEREYGILLGIPRGGPEWKGSLSSAPENPKRNWAYRNTADGQSYIHDGEKWNTYVDRGTRFFHLTENHPESATTIPLPASAPDGVIAGDVLAGRTDGNLFKVAADGRGSTR